MKTWKADVQAEISLVIRDEHMILVDEDYTQARERAYTRMKNRVARAMRVVNFGDYGDYDLNILIHLEEVEDGD